MKVLANTLIAFTVLLFLSACGTSQTAQQNSPASPSAATTVSAKTSTSATKINVTETEMAIKLPSTTAPAGAINFVVHNSGSIPHEFVVLKAEVPDNKLPMKGDELDEDGKGVKHIAEIGEEDLKSGATKTLNVNLTPGRYLLVCNLPGHYKAGMKTYLTVK